MSKSRLEKLFGFKPKGFRCEHCGKTYKRESAIQKHVLGHFTTRKPSPPMFFVSKEIN